MARSRRKKDYKLLYLVGILIIIIILVISLSRTKEKQENEVIKQEEKTVEEVQDMEHENITAQLQDMEERERMEFYFGMFLNYIEEEEYKRAYDLLYAEFRENYFPTLDSFTQYVQKTFPKMAGITYDNIERNGDVYILWIYIADVLNGKPNDEKIKMNIVIQEMDYNHFVMSFSVI